MTDLKQAAQQTLEQPDRQALQAAGTHPAPCARHCEAKAFEIEIRSLKSALRASLEQSQIEFSKPGEWVMRITADRRIEVNEDVTVTEAAQTVLEAVQKLLNQPEQRKPLTGEQIEFAWMKAMQSTPGTTLPIHEFARAIEQAHGIGESHDLGTNCI